MAARDVIIDRVSVLHGRHFDLTRNVVTLNAVSAVVSGLVVGGADKTGVGGSVYLAFFGLLIALFGVIFNLGASTVHDYLTERMDRLVMMAVELEAKHRMSPSSTYVFFSEKDPGTGRRLAPPPEDLETALKGLGLQRSGTTRWWESTYKLTKIFFSICACVWIMAGSYLVSLWLFPTS